MTIYAIAQERGSRCSIAAGQELLDRRNKINSTERSALVG